MHDQTDAAAAEERTYVLLTVAGQLCGIPVLGVRDVLADQRIAPIPLAPPEVAGNLNLRGRIVTAIDLRARLRLPAREPSGGHMAIVTEQGGELYALLADEVAEVVTLGAAALERNPPTLPPVWAEHSQGIFRVGERLMVVLDPGRLLNFEQALAA
jgi:purine-binding chemotaxis protein CheW